MNDIKHYNKKRREEYSHVEIKKLTKLKLAQYAMSKNMRQVEFLDWALNKIFEAIDKKNAT